MIHGNKNPNIESRNPKEIRIPKKKIRNGAVVTSKVERESADQKLVAGVLARQPRALARAITLVESTRRDHQLRAAALLEALLPHTGGSIRIGITGAPGAGKSTFIESLGLYLLERGHRLAVLAVDPSSSLSGGSILGDKTRMEQLARHPNTFIRPSPSGGSLGGVAQKTRESLLVCEAAGFDVVIVETVGVGQSETAVAGMVDVFVLLQLPNAGDELQALKRGIAELADIVVINKADLDPPAAERARQQFSGALSFLRPVSSAWQPPVLAVSATAGTGIDRFWNEIERFREVMNAEGILMAKRQHQALAWMWSLIETGLQTRFRQHPQVRHNLEPLSRAVAAGQMTPTAAAQQLLGYL
jgi:LAO/AO transport system kinase